MATNQPVIAKIDDPLSLRKISPCTKAINVNSMAVIQAPAYG